MTVEDLRRIKEAYRPTTILREGGYKAKITVHMGSCGIASGARKVMATLLDEIAKREIKDVIVTTSDCVGLCNREPMATVELVGKSPVKYVDLNSEKIIRILIEHVLSEKPVEEYALVIDSKTTY